ncbi:MAG: sulfur carrier protein ThiS [Planctomycetales bacterium]|nr:sulfur carrier protein ThiS [Planctomycetales bacterium]
MQLNVNGQPRDAPEGCTIGDLLEALEVRTRGVAVELNREVIPRDQHATTRLAEGDELEVVTLVGGG